MIQENLGNQFAEHHTEPFIKKQQQKLKNLPHGKILKRKQITKKFLKF